MAGSEQTDCDVYCVSGLDGTATGQQRRAHYVRLHGPVSGAAKWVNRIGFTVVQDVVQSVCVCVRARARVRVCTMPFDILTFGCTAHQVVP